MNMEESDRNQSSRRDHTASVSTRLSSRSRRSAIPQFNHNSDDLKKKNAMFAIPNFQKNLGISRFTDLQKLSHDSPKLNSYSVSNLSLIVSSRFPLKQSKAARIKEIQPKILNPSEEDLPNPEPETERDLSIIVNNNNSIHEIPHSQQEVNLDDTTTRRVQRREEQGDDSHFQLINQSSNIQANRAAHDLSSSNVNNNNLHNNPEPPAAVQPAQVANQPNEQVEYVPGISAEKAEDWQHELTIRANHKFIVVQWSLIFTILGSLLAYASLIGETPINILFLILALVDGLYIFSALRFFQIKRLHSKKGLNKALKLLDWVIFTALTLGGFLKTSNQDMKLILYLIPVPVLIILRLAFLRKKRTSNIRIVIWLQLILLTLRIDNIFEFNWFLVFLIAIGVCIGFIARIVYLGLQINKKRELRKELIEEMHQRLIKIKIVGIIWELLIDGFGAIFLLVFVGVAQRIETQENSVLLGVVLIFTMVYSILLIYISLKYKYEITRSIITKIIRNDPEHIKVQELLKNELELGVTRKSAPKYLVKMSSTYYQVAKAKPEKGKKVEFVTVGDIREQEEEEEEKENGEERRESSNEEEERSKRSENKDEEEEGEEEGEEGSASEEQKEEASEEREGDNCFVCCDRKPNAVIMECGHGGVCYHCGMEMWKKEEKCYLCRQKISRLLKLEEAMEDDDLAKVQIAITFNKNKKININESFQDVLNDV